MYKVIRNKVLSRELTPIHKEQVSTGKEELQIRLRNANKTVGRKSGE